MIEIAYGTLRDDWGAVNLFPRSTGLPVSARFTIKQNRRHAVRVWVEAPAPLTAEDERTVKDWIALNEDPIRDYWEGRIDSVDAINRLRRLP